MVETAVVGVVVMALSLGLVQFGIWYHAQHVVLAAAQEGAHEAALEGADASDGESRARALVTAGLGSLARGAEVTVSATDDLTTASVEVHMSPLVPLFPSITVAAEGRAFKERFVTPQKDRR